VVAAAKRKVVKLVTVAPYRRSVSYAYQARAGRIFSAAASPGPAMLRVEEFRDIESLSSLADEWRRLLAQTPNANFFQSLDWLTTYWRHYGEGQRLRLLVVRDDAGVAGIVPLTVLREPSRLGGLRTLTYPQAYWGSFYGSIGPDPATTLRAALQHIARSRRDWDVIDLRFAPRYDVDPAETVEALVDVGFRSRAKQTDATALIDLPTTFDAYLATRTSKWRMNCRRWTRRLEEQGDVRFARYRPRGEADVDGDPRFDLYDACEQVASQSWQAKSTDGTTLTHDSIRPFLRNVHAVACRAGAADINLLYLDGRPIAFLYGYTVPDETGRGAMFGLRSGFDANVPVGGIGNILYMRVIEDSIARGDRLIDLGPGSLPAKQPFLTRVEPIFRHAYGNRRSWLGNVWHLKQAWERRFPKPTEQILPLAASLPTRVPERVASDAANETVEASA
jgi:CelD/BcsL family acetyltransferase involved in cellulose biosynthesis